MKKKIFDIRYKFASVNVVNGQKAFDKMLWCKWRPQNSEAHTKKNWSLKHKMRVKQKIKYWLENVDNKFKY